MIQTVQFKVITLNLSEVGSPNMAGPGVSAAYHLVWIHLGLAPLPGLHIRRHLSVPYCGIGVPLYAVRNMLLGSSPVGSPFISIWLGYSLSMTLNGMTFPHALVSTFIQTEELVLPSQLVGRWAMVYASVFLGLATSSTLILSGSSVKLRSGLTWMKCISISSHWLSYSSTLLKSVHPFFPCGFFFPFPGCCLFPLCF